MAKLLSTIIDGFISSKKFVSGLMGEGWRIGKRGSRYALEVDDIIVRNTMTVFELLISKIRAVRGAMAITQAFGKIKEVREEEDCYILALEDENSFMVNDLVRCKAFGEGAREYWVKVSAVSDLEITIHKSEFDENMSTPQIGDELVQMGNTTDTPRQSAIYLSADENGTPAIDVLQGIREKSLEGCTKVRVGGLDGMVDTDFPDGIKDFGIYCENGYFKGTIAGGGGYMLRSDGTGYICNGAIWWDEQKKVHFDGEVVLEWENLPADAKELLKGDKGDKGDTGEKGEDANLLPWVEEWNNNSPLLSSDGFLSPRIFAGEKIDGKLTGVAIGRNIYMDGDGKKKTGIFGLNQGKETFVLDAETGEAMYKGCLDINGKFKVDDQGNLFANSADISGRVVADSGRIGGFNISGNILENDNNSEDASLIFRNDRLHKFAAIGGNTLTPSSSVALLRLENNENNRYGVNYGAIIDVTGASKNIALDISNGDLSLNNGNILLNNGVIQNFCLSVKVLKDNYTIPDNETCTIYMNGADKKIDLILPANPPVGKVIMARVWGSHAMGIVAPSGFRVVVRDDTQWTQIEANSGGTFGNLSLVYFGNIWEDKVKRWFAFEGHGNFSQGNG